MFGKKKLKTDVANLGLVVNEQAERIEEVTAQRDEARRDTTILERRLNAANAKLKQYGHINEF